MYRTMTQYLAYRRIAILSCRGYRIVSIAIVWYRGEPDTTYSLSANQTWSFMKESLRANRDLYLFNLLIIFVHMLFIFYTFLLGVSVSIKGRVGKFEKPARDR